MIKKHEIKIGQTFHYLTILKELPPRNQKRTFLVRCVCGKEKAVKLADLLNGSTKSCGCKRAKTHGMSRTRIYKIWQTMVYRCAETKMCGAWEKYGKKGIRVCEEWQGKNGFVNFYNWAIKNGYSDNLTIDRIDGTKGYYPENCRWATYETQNCNLSMLSTNKSGYKGVSYEKKTGKWVCVISINNHSVRIGAFNTQKEAVEKRNQYIDEHHLPHQKNVYKGELSYGY